MNLFTKSFDWLKQTLVNKLDRFHLLAMVPDSIEYQKKNAGKLVFSYFLQLDDR